MAAGRQSAKQLSACLRPTSLYTSIENRAGPVVTVVMVAKSMIFVRRTTYRSLGIVETGLFVLLRL